MADAFSSIEQALFVLSDPSDTRLGSAFASLSAHPEADLDSAVDQASYSDQAKSH